MSAEEKLMDCGFEGVKYLTNYSYDDALIGVSHDGRAIYDYNLMIDWLMSELGWSDNEAIEWIEFNTQFVLYLIWERKRLSLCMGLST